MQIINIGFNGIVNGDRVVAVLDPDSAPIRRRVQQEKEAGTLIDATYGRKIRSVIFMDSGQIVVSAIAPETISQRIGAEEKSAL